MLEAVLGAAAAGLISAGSAAAMAAARRSGETRDAVLRLSGKFEALDARMASHVLDGRTTAEVLERRLQAVEQRVSALEAGFVDRRRSG